MTAEQQENKYGDNPSSPGRRIRALQDRTDGQVQHDLIDEVCFLEDRVLYLEAALHHISALLRLNAHDLPDPIRPQLHVAPEVPL